MNIQGEAGSHSQHRPEPFTLGKGMGLREGKRQREGRNGEEEKEIEGRKVNGRLFPRVLFPVRTRQLSHGVRLYLPVYMLKTACQLNKT